MIIVGFIVINRTQYKQYNWPYYQNLIKILGDFFYFLGDQMLIKREKGHRKIYTQVNRQVLKVKTLGDIDVLSSETPYSQLRSKNTTGLDKKQKAIFDEEINLMFKKVTNVVHAQHINMYEALSYVKSSILFKEIDQVNQNALTQTYRPENLHNQTMYNSSQRYISQSKVTKDKKDQEQFDQSVLKIHISQRIQTKKLKFNEIIEQIYQKAKILPFNNFSQFYRSMQSNNRLELFNVKKNNRHFRVRQAKEGYVNIKAQMISNIVQFFTYKYTPDQIKQLESFLDKQLNFQCKNPCCKWSQDPITTNPSAFTLATQNPKKIRSNKIKTIYKSDKVDEYYNRYYNSTFRIDNIKNIVKTNGEEMQKLYKQYMSKHKFGLKIKSKAHFRNESVI